MEYRPLGNAGMKVSAVGLGGWLTFGGQLGIEEVREIVRTAVDQGILFFDLADIYARGEAERVFGQVLKEFRRQDLVISTKVFWPMSDNPNDRGLSRKHIFESIDNSLRRLGTDYVDLYFAHRFDPETPVEEVVRAMSDLVQAGKVLYWGTSVWSAAQIAEAVGVAELRNLYRPQAEQPRYNLLDRHIEAEILPLCRRHGIGLTVWSPLAQGLLTGKYNDGIPPESRAARSDWLKGELTEANLAKVRRFTDLARELDLTPAQLALAWVLHQPGISSAITGATRPEQVVENARAAEVRLSAEVLERIEAIFGGGEEG